MKENQQKYIEYICLGNKPSSLNAADFTPISPSIGRNHTQTNEKASHSVFREQSEGYGPVNVDGLHLLCTPGTLIRAK
jgi:hypothetical protein